MTVKTVSFLLKIPLQLCRFLIKEKQKEDIFDWRFLFWAVVETDDGLVLRAIRRHARDGVLRGN